MPWPVSRTRSRTNSPPRLQMQPDVIVIEGHVGGLQVQGPALGHGIAGVEAQIHQHLVDLALVGLNVPQRPRSLNFHRDARIDGTAKDARDLLDGRVQIDDFQAQHGAAGEPEKLARQLGGPLSCFFGGLDHLAVRAISRQAARQKADVSQDGGEEVVEIVRDPAGQLTDCFHLLRLAELVFQPLAFRDVAGDADQAERPSVRAEERRLERLHQDGPAVGIGDPFLTSFRLALRQHLPIAFLVAGRRLAGKKFESRSNRSAPFRHGPRILERGVAAQVGTGWSL